MRPPGWKVPNMLLRKSGGQLLIAAERMKWLGQRRHDAQLWMCLVMKIKPDSVKKKKNTTIFHRNLECQVHESR